MVFAVQKSICRREFRSSVEASRICISCDHGSLGAFSDFSRHCLRQWGENALAAARFALASGLAARAVRALLT